MVPAAFGASVEGVCITHVPPQGRHSIKVLKVEPDSEWKVEQGHSIECWGQGQSDCVCHGPSVEVPRVASSPPSPLCPSLSPGAGRLPPRIPGRGGWPPARVALPAWTSLEVLSLLSGAQRMELSLGAGPAAPGVAARYGLASGGHQEQGWVSG